WDKYPLCGKISSAGTNAIWGNNLSAGTISLLRQQVMNYDNMLIGAKYHLGKHSGLSHLIS
ncbi:hypothetical protein BgiMline_014521, partial [Biomphalaria glabrata]